jgi:sterol desaturase/sphingolipid hydroxylase (fatty acid hydroxylase superfamily)
MRFVESLSHANIRLSFGWLGDRLIVSPCFHRLHHGLRAAGRVSCNYGAVFPIWDIIFGTADFTVTYPATGDRNAPEAMASGGYFAQQWSGFQHFANALGRSRRKSAITRQ